MKIETESISGTLVYRIMGNVSFDNWEQISKELDNFQQLGEKYIVVNWQALENIDTSGLQTLVRLVKISRANPGFKFALVTANPGHIRLITMCGFDKLIQVFPNESDAVESC